MVVPIIAAVVVILLFGAGPVLVNDTACSSDSVDATEQNVSGGCTKCDVDEVQAAMRTKEVPTELKIEIEGKLYSVPDDAEMVARTPKASKTKWWKRFGNKDKSLSDKLGGSDASDKAKHSGSDPARTSESVDDGGVAAAVAEKTVRSAGEHSCQICFGQDQSTVLLPCGHGGLCWDCGLQIYALTEECPFCRSKIEVLVPLDNGTRRYEGEVEFVSSAEYSEDGKPMVALRPDPALSCIGES